MKAPVNGNRPHYLPMRKGRKAFAAFLALTLAALLAGPHFIKSAPAARAADASSGYVDLDGHEKRVPDIHASAAAITPRSPSAAQLRALDQLKANLNDRSVTARWHQATGSIDMLLDSAFAPSSPDPVCPGHGSRVFKAAFLLQPKNRPKNRR